MNKVKLTLLTAICIATAFTFLACEEKSKKAEPGGGVKLLESIIYDDGLSQKFEYDTQNRIAKMSFYRNWDGMKGTETFTYSGNDLVKLERGGHINGSDAAVVNYVRNGNLITIKDYSEGRITLDKDGYLIEVGYLSDGGRSLSSTETFQYKDGNLIKITDKIMGNPGKITVTEFKNDNKKSPFFHCNTPKWVLKIHFMEGGYFGLNNNVTEILRDGISIETTKYEYDSDGFPIKSITWNPNRSTKEITTFFTYRSGTSAKGVGGTSDGAASKAAEEEESEPLPKTKAECIYKKIGSPKTVEAVFLESECGEGCYVKFRLADGKEIVLGGQDDTLEKGTKVSITYQREQRWIDYDFVGQGQWCDHSDNLESLRVLGK